MTIIRGARRTEGRGTGSSSRPRSGSTRDPGTGEDGCFQMTGARDACRVVRTSPRALACSGSPAGSPVRRSRSGGVRLGRMSTFVRGARQRRTKRAQLAPDDVADVALLSVQEADSARTALAGCDPEAIAHPPGWTVRRCLSLVACRRGSPRRRRWHNRYGSGRVDSAVRPLKPVRISGLRRSRPVSPLLFVPASHRSTSSLSGVGTVRSAAGSIPQCFNAALPGSLAR